jgi:hypothetical protein
LAALLVALILGPQQAASASVPTTVVYQGFLAYDGGAPFDGNVDVQLALHASPNAATLPGGVAWGPAQFNDVVVKDGVFEVVMGAASGPPLAADVLASGPLWLALWIDGTLMQPLQSVHAVPYALVASSAATLGGKPPSAFATAQQLAALHAIVLQQQAAIEELQEAVTWTSACCDAVLPVGVCLPVTPNGTPCDDGNLCTSGDVCVGGSCVGTVVTCDDGNPCTTDSCAPALGCASAVNSLPCNDNDPCTSGDTCVAGSCTGAPVSCNDGLTCTTDSCVGGTCTNALLPNFCKVGGVCYAAGSQNPNSGCELCDPGQNTAGFVPNAACGAIDLNPSWSPSSVGFDVANDGSITTAGWNIATQQVTAVCYNADGSPSGTSTVLGTFPSFGSGRIYVARADVTRQSMVVVFPWPTDDSPTTLYAYSLNASCGLVGAATQLPGLSQQLTGGSLEYLDVVMGDLGHAAVVYQGKVNSGPAPTWPHLAQFNPQGVLISQKPYGVGQCNEAGNGVRVGMRETTGDVVVTCQGHAWVPIRAQRFSSTGVAVDSAMWQVPNSSGNSSWYDSHIAGMHDDGSFVIAWQISSGKRLDAAFFSPSSVHYGNVTLGGGVGEWFDGYRRVHARIQPLQSGGYFIPGPTDYTPGFRWFGVASKDGALLYSQLLTQDVPLLRAAANDDVLVLLGLKIQRNLAPFVY